MRTPRSILALVLAIAALALPAYAAADSYATSTTAVDGYDLVSYHTGEKPLRGDGNHVVEHDGVAYLFVDEQNRAQFAADPERYLPAYGGYCAFGVAVGKKFVGDPDVWKIVDGRLYLNLDTSIQAKWSDDIAGHIRKANATWPQIRTKAPAAL